MGFNTINCDLMVIAWHLTTMNGGFMVIHSD